MVDFNRIKNKLKYTPKHKEIDLNDGGEPIKIIINPSEKMKNNIIEIVIKNKNEETDYLDLSKKEIFVPITKIVTDIKFNDSEEESMFMDFLFKEPSGEAENLRDEIIKVINKILTEFIQEVDKLTKNINEKELEEIINNNNIK